MATCIFCRKPFDPLTRPETAEHVFPEAIGGALVIERVCKPCNDKLGAKIDTTLTDYFPIIACRERFRIRGKTGSVPSAFMLLMKGAHLAEDPDQKVRFEINPDTGLPELFLMRRVKKTEMKGGVAISLVLDERELAEATEIVQKIARRAGKSISPAHLAEQIEKYTSSSIDQPLIKSSGKIKLTEVRLGLVKIAYELAWHWLGDEWLDDPVADAMRQAIVSSQSFERVHGWIGTPEEKQLFSLLRVPPSTHVAMSSNVEGCLIIAIKIFDCLSCAFTVSRSPTRYGHLPRFREGFLIELDPLTMSKREWPFMAGAMRLGNWEMIMSDEEAARHRANILRTYPDSMRHDRTF